MGRAWQDTQLGRAKQEVLPAASKDGFTAARQLRVPPGIHREEPMPKIDDRIEALEAKLKQLKTQQQRSEARARTVAAKRARHEELRRKILAGAVLLSKVEAGEFEEETLKTWMRKALTRPEDRALFGLES
jgi:hypothetical protein